MATQNKNLSEYDKNSLPNIKNTRFGIVTSQWNFPITENLRKGAIQTLLDCGASQENITEIAVPGSFELVSGARKLLTQNLDAIIVIGCVIQGETKHFDFVCQGVTHGISHLNAIQNTPIIFCVLTDNTWEQSVARSGGELGNKGVEAAITAIQMAHI